MDITNLDSLVAKAQNTMAAAKNGIAAAQNLVNGTSLAEKALQQVSKMPVFDTENIIPDKSIVGAIPDAGDVSRGIFTSRPDPRKLKQPSSSTYTPKIKNARGMIGQFIEHAANVGFQRNNRFVVLIHGPSINTDMTRDAVAMGSAINFQNRKAMDTKHKTRLALTCQQASIHGKALMTEEYTNTGNGPNTLHAYGENYSNDLTLEFLCSSDFFERMYFESWMNKIVNTGTHEVSLYEDYAKPWSILIACLPADFNSSSRSGVTFEDVTSQTITNPKSDIYFIQYDHVYPYRIADQPLSYGSVNEHMKFSVQFRYHRWYDPLVKYMERKQYIRHSLQGLPSAKDALIENFRRRPVIEKGIGAVPEGFIPVARLDGPNYNPLEGPIDLDGGQYGLTEEKLSPFEKFKKIARDVARYSNPQELKGLIINQGLGQLNDIIGEGNVETIAQAGQIVDVYRQTENKDITSTSNKLIGPLGQLL